MYSDDHTQLPKETEASRTHKQVKPQIQDWTCEATAPGSGRSWTLGPESTMVLIITSSGSFSGLANPFLIFPFLLTLLRMMDIY